MADQVRIKVILEGRVQGVGFRYHTQRKATELGVVGYVRNMIDGRVEAVFEGVKPVVDEMLKWCETGPPYANVDYIAIRHETPVGILTEFEVKH